MTTKQLSVTLALVVVGALTACGVTNPTGVAVTGVTLKSSTSMVVGGTEQLSAVIAPSDATDQTVSWASSNPRVATVKSGLVTAVAVGTATITVTTADGAKTASCAVTVTADPTKVASIALDATTASITIGATKTLTATIAPATATNQNVTWTTSDASIASISTAAGGSTVVTGVAAGTVTIVATAAGDSTKTASCTVTVTTIPVTGVTLSDTSTSLVVGATKQLTTTVAPSNATNQAVSWSSDATSIATVSSTGLVSALATGTATITVTTADGAKTDTCVVTVSPVTVTGVGLNHASLSLAVQPGTSQTLTASIAPSGATNQNLTWTTSDSTVASLSATTGSTVTVTPVHAGTATITVKTEDGNFTKTCAVSVALLDVTIAKDTASKNLTQGSNGPGFYSSTVAGTYAEVTVGPLVFYSDDNGFEDGDADLGIFFNWYASGSGASVGATQSMKSYIGIPAASVQTTSTSTKVTVSAKADSTSTGSRIALLTHSALASGRVIALSVPLSATKAEYVFDGVPPNVQIDLRNGGADGNSLYVEAVKVEASSSAVADTTPPAEVTNLAKATDLTLNTQVVLSWTNPTDADFASAQISSADIPTPISVDKASSGYTVTGLTTGKTYTFTIKTVDTSGNLSNGVTINATPGVPPPLLDEALTPKNADDAQTACSAASGVEQTVTGSHLAFYSNGGWFQGNSSKFMIGSVGVSTAVVGATPATVTAYIGIPATYTTTTAPSIKITLMATQYNATPLNLVLLDASNKVIASQPLSTSSTGGGSTPIAYTFDGVVPGGEIKISGDAVYLYLTNVKVEASSTATTDTTPPAEVTNLAKATEATQVTLSWTNPTDTDFAGVRISYAGLATPISVDKTLSAYAVTGLTTGTSYAFTVKTIDTSGNLSSGVTISATPSATSLLLDEALPSALATAAYTACTGSGAGIEQSLTGSHLVFYLNGGWFQDNGGKFMLGSPGISTTAVGSTPATVQGYVGIPATYTATTATSVKVTVTAAQYNAGALNLVLLGSGNKVIASTPLAAGSGGGSSPAAYTFDGVIPGGEIKISGDAQYLYITNVKVEASSTAVTYQ